MVRFTRDPLLGVARIVVLVLMSVVAFAAAVCALVIPIVLIRSNAVRIGIDSGPVHLDGQTIPLVIALLVTAIGLLALLYVFFRHLKRIIETVAMGDPFIPENAHRLTAMAWLMLAIQIGTIPVLALAMQIGRRLGDTDGDISGGVDLSGIVMVIVLFILARVFRSGAKMREDLEGTV